MEHTRNGDLKVGYEQELSGRRGNGGTLAAYLDLTGESINGGVARVPLPPKSSAPSRRRTYADGELDVFSAERYFKGAMDDDHKDKQGPAAPVETAARPAVLVSKPAWTSRASAAPSAGSGGSANSQTVLLRDARRRRPGYRGNKCCGLQVSELLRPCSGKRAVRVDDGGAAKEADEPSKTAASRIEWYRDLRMEKANLELAAGEVNRGGVVASGLQTNLSHGAAKVAAVGREEKTAEYVSASFRSGSFTLQAPVKVSGGCRDEGDGSGSESSSDLFEIKSLMIDDCPYEPSEASIQWSVVTASAAGMSAPSERGGGRGGARGRGPVTTRPQNRERPVGLLTGCVSRRAVNVSAISAGRGFPDSPVRRRIGG
uniref:Uncharacterized protein n=1 Tax=Avena sativa TaxID=4498 RepID=A0ACD5TBJ1_AVESA